MTETPREKFDMLSLHKALICIFGCMLVYDYYHRTTPAIVRIPNPKFSLLGPYSANQIVVNDTYDQLIDMKDFSFLMNPQPCSDYQEGILLAVIIASRPTNFKNRMVIRNTWGRSLDSTKVVFMIGESSNVNTSLKILNESQIHGDIIQGNFVDAYRNMTYKHVMGLKWIVHHCPMAKYVLKTDDDIVVNAHELRRFLAKKLSPWGARGLITCQVLEHAPAQRSTKSKWKVSVTEFSAQYYPTYCAGWAILYSQDVVPRLLAVAQKLPYFWIDDVHITGICAQMIGVTRTQISSFILNRRLTNMLTTFGFESVEPFLFGPPDLSLDMMNKIWKAIPE